MFRYISSMGGKKTAQFIMKVASDVLLLLRMVLLLLLEMASDSPVAAAQKGISPALDGAITLTKIGWQMSY